MKQPIYWITLCSVAVCGVWGNRIDRDGTNNIQNPGANERNNKKQVTLNRPNTLNQRFPPDLQTVAKAGDSPPPQPSDFSPVAVDKSPPDPAALLHASESEGKLTMDFLAETGKITKDDFVLSPLGIWSITTMIFSAAGGKTASQLAKLLRTDKVSRSTIEAAYKAAYNQVNYQNEAVESKMISIGANLADEKISNAIINHYQSVFNAKWFTIKEREKKDAVEMVNNWAATWTKQRITNIVEPTDFNSLKVFLATASFFKGRWQQPFNASATFPDVFRDENDNIVQNGVPMMRMRGVFQYGYNTKLECQILELPYADGATSMLVFLPRRKLPIQNVLENMRESSLADLIPNEMSEEEVDVSFPRFSTEFRANLNAIFVNLNAGRMHSSEAELPRLSNNTYISKIAQAVEIETTEEGTIASAITSALVSYKTTATNFQANRPFIYFINDVRSRLVLFAGKISKPSVN